MVAIQNYFAQVGAWVTLVQGIIFVACVLTLRLGIVVKLREWSQRRNRYGQDAGVDPNRSG